MVTVTRCYHGNGFYVVQYVPLPLPFPLCGNDRTIYLAIYVGDILIASMSNEIRSNAWSLLTEQFGIKIRGPATWILSLHVCKLHQVYITGPENLHRGADEGI